jgi:alpha-tubulin suppressor-like RCC1 family protein
LLFAGDALCAALNWRVLLQVANMDWIATRGRLLLAALVSSLTAFSCARTGLELLPPAHRDSFVPTRLAMGPSQVCALDAEGRSRCVGVIRAGTWGTPLSDIAETQGRTLRWLFGQGTCRLDSEGRTSCAGVSPAPPLTASYAASFVSLASLGEPVVEFDGTGRWTCFALRSGKVVCSGERVDRTVPLSAQTVSFLSAGAADIAVAHEMVCALQRDGARSVHCAGRFDGGDAVVGSFAADGTATLAPIGLEGVRSVEGNHFLAIVGINTSGDAWWWGSLIANDAPREQIVTTARRPTVVAGGPASSVAFGAGFGCVLRTSGAVDCFGQTSSGQAGVRSERPASELRRIRLPGRASALAAHERTACALVEGDVYCWGAIPTPRDAESARRWYATPTEQLASIDARSLYFDDERSYAVDSTGRVWGWRNDTQPFGREDFAPPHARDDVGTGSVLPPNVPTILPGLERVRQVSFSCALDDSGRVFEWGTGGAAPRANALLVDVVEVACSRDVVIARLADGRVVRAARANGVTAAPVAVPAWSNARSISASAYHACVVRSDGVVECGGDGAFGALGEAMPAEPRAFVTVSLPGPARSVVARNDKSCAIGDRGDLWCWGLNVLHELGAAPSTAVFRPVLSNQLRTVRSVHPHSSGMCSLTMDGRVECFGANYFGQAGSPAVGVESNTAVSLSLEGVDGLTGGADFTCATFAAAPPRCWGLAANHELGDGRRGVSEQPTLVVFDSPAR